MFRQLDKRVFAAPQISPDEVAEAARLGIGMIVNNRPEGESDDQTSGPDIAAAAAAAGLDYVAIPVTHAGFSMPQVEAMREALDRAGARGVLAYCRSGTRSTLLWALAEAHAGRAPDEISAAAAQAGYDVGPIRPQLDMLSGKAG